MRRRGGFTLVEMLVVIIIITILTGTTVMLANNIMRGQAVRQAAMIVKQGVAQAKQMAAATRRVHFLVFSPTGQEGWLEIHADSNGSGDYQGDQDPKTDSDQDRMVQGHRIDLPQFVVFEVAPAWIAFQPSGYITMHDSGGGLFPEVQASSFDAIMNGSDPRVVGDVVIAMLNRPYKQCMDLDRAAGKVRRDFFLAREQ